jgi:hypothetical protein
MTAVQPGWSAEIALRLLVNSGRSVAPSQAIPQRIYIWTIESLIVGVSEKQIPCEAIADAARLGAVAVAAFGRRDRMST